jgi:O-antigen ligase
MSGSLSIAKISGSFCFVIYFFYHNSIFSKRSFPRLPKAMWWFLGYLTVYVVSGIFIPAELLPSFLTRLLTLVQLLVLFWIASDLLQDEKMAQKVLFVFSISSVILAVSSLLHLFGAQLTQFGEGRMTALEYNPGTLGVLMALSMITLLGLFLNTASKKSFIRNVLLLALSFPLLKVMLDTGSRGALATLIAGCLVFVLPSLNLKMRFVAIAIALAGIGATLYMAVHNPDYSERWQQTYYEGNLSGRDRIYSAAMEMAAERLIVGWQPVVNWYELGARLGEPLRDAHSLYLHLLLEVGLLGTVPFLIGLWLCTRSAWKARMGEFGPLPLALILAALTSNLTDTFIVRKPLWLILGLTLAVGSNPARGRAMIMRMVRAR